ncbi:glycoside hydrolase family 6 protein [Streptomyces sp. Ru72]|uniref:glycoside hydrolase family 6 protein n=1 Tax=Streptomyces sp. Ru72 TaxID=2080747 RepID=UPI000CDE361E|nr:glycoside hydrolase family 6 protein [Streptomyces sp. Ru72]POX47621.1 endoglucanase [Streptomyces sp. Ru72]
MVAVASAVVAVGTAAGMMSALDDGRGTDRARPAVTRRAVVQPPPAPSSTPAETPGTSPAPSSTRVSSAVPSPTPSARRPRTEVAPVRLYRHTDSQVLDWIATHRDDPRRAVIESRIADRPAAVWFADPSPSTITARVRAVTSAAAAEGRVPVLVAYTVPDRDCGGASGGGAPGLAAYDAWIDAFAAGLGSGEVIVILEPDSVAQSDCLTKEQQAGRFASLARAGRVLKAADRRARVYYDGGHSGWKPATEQASLLEQAGAGSPQGSDGIFTNVSNFQRTTDEIAYARQVLAGLRGPASLGAVIDTSRNGNGPPADGRWCDPAGRRIGQAPTLRTGQARIDAYLWVKLPGESDGCKGAAGTFSPSYAYDLAR